jgi:TRAP-type C4-dicarboxylate transport system permease small subunit
MPGHRLKKAASVFWEVILAGCVVVLCVGVFVQVLLRYALKTSFPPMEEVVSISFIYTIFLGAAIGMKRMQHLEIDFLLKRISPRFKKFFYLAIFAATAVFLVYVVKEGAVFVLDSYGQTTTYLNLPISYSYAAIPAGGVLMLYYLLRRGSSLLRGQRPVGSTNHEDGP